MPADNRKLELRSLLTGKSTEELEELLSLDFAEDKKCVDAEYIATILEVIEEREQSKEDRTNETERAWNEFQAYYTQAEPQEELEAGRFEKPTHYHRRKTENRQKSRNRASMWRISVVAAVLIVLLCGTAFGWNFFQAIVEWTEETLHFLTGQNSTELPKPEALVYLRASVAEWTDVPVIPHRAPEGTQEFGSLNVMERNNRYTIGQGYIVGDRRFSIRIIVYSDIQDVPFNTYQKDTTIYEEYTVNGITHYIVGNKDNLSAMWTNGNVEGHIQGNLTLTELRQMIDSIYEE